MDPYQSRFAPLLLTRAIDGVQPFLGAKQLVHRYRDDADFPHDEARLQQLLRTELRKTFAAGFVTGMGGALTLPLSLPAGLVAAWLLQARLASCVALLRGHDVEDRSVRGSLLKAVSGAQAPEMWRQASLGAAQWAARRGGGKLAPRLLRRGAGRSIGRWVPVAGGALGGGLDYVASRRVAQTALRIFGQRRLLAQQS